MEDEWAKSFYKMAVSIGELGMPKVPRYIYERYERNGKRAFPPKEYEDDEGDEDMQPPRKKPKLSPYGPPQAEDESCRNNQSRTIEAPSKRQGAIMAPPTKEGTTSREAKEPLPLFESTASDDGDDDQGDQLAGGTARGIGDKDKETRRNKVQAERRIEAANKVETILKCCSEVQS